MQAHATCKQSQQLVAMRPVAAHTRASRGRSHMTNDLPDTRTGARSTRLGLVALGFVIGAIVTLIVVFAIRMA